MPQPSNQKGFAIIEALLIVIILGMIGGTGYYVWHSKLATDTILGNEANTSQVSTAKPVGGKQTTQQYKFTVKEWSLEAKYTSDQQLTYSYSKDDDAVAITSKQLVSYGGDCATKPADSIIRLKPSDPAPIYGGYATATQAAQDPMTDGVMINGYYYFSIPVQEGCALNSDPKFAAAATEQTSVVNIIAKQIMPHLVAITH